MKFSPFLRSALLGAAVYFAACSKDDAGTSGGTSSVPIEIGGGDAAGSGVTFVADGPWTASVSDDWCAVYPDRGSAGEQTLTLAAQPNDTGAARTAALTVRGLSDQVRYTVRQQAAPRIELPGGPLIRVDASPRRFEVQVNASVRYEVCVTSDGSEPIPDWLTAPASGKETGKLIFSVTANPLPRPRTARVTLTGPGGLTASFDILQQWVRQMDADLEIDIPDAAFRDFLLAQYDRDGNGKLSHGEVKTVVALDCSSAGIASLEGIGYFDALRSLDCSGNRLASLDLSECEELQYLDCDDNALTRLGVGGCARLRELSAERNRILTLDLRGNALLERAFLDDNSFTSLFVRGCSSLVTLRCSNSNLTSIDLSGCTRLEAFRCPDAALASIRTAGCASLRSLTLDGNRFRTLDLRSCAGLEQVWCSRMPTLEAVFTASVFPTVTPRGPVPFMYVGAYFHWIYLPYIYVGGDLRSQQVALESPV